MSQGRFPCLFALFAGLVAGLVAVTIWAGGPRAAPADLADWNGARWGMTEAELAEVFGAALTPLPGRWLDGGAYATQAVFGVEVGGLDFTAYFQMNAESGRLQQVLLERRANQVSPAVYEAVLASMEQAYGPAEGLCLERHRPNDPGAPPRRESLRWRFPTTTVQLTWLDFLTTSVMFDDPDPTIDPLVPRYKTRRINRRTLPRRIIIRFHPSERHDLVRWQDCEAAEVPAPK